MPGRSVVPSPLGDEVGDESRGLDVPHPVVRVGARDAVLGVLVRAARGLRGLGHARHRTATRVLAALALLLAAVTGPALLTPAHAAQDSKVIFTVGMGNEVDSFNPFLGIEAESYEMWALTYDY